MVKDGTARGEELIHIESVSMKNDGSNNATRTAAFENCNIKRLFPFVLHSFLTENHFDDKDGRDKGDGFIVKWVVSRDSNSDGDTTEFAINRNHAKLPALLKKYFGHEKYESIRRQLNMYDFRMNKDQNFEHQVSSSMKKKLFRRYSTDAELIQIKSHPKVSRMKQRLLEQPLKNKTEPQGHQEQQSNCKYLDNERKNHSLDLSSATRNKKSAISVGMYGKFATELYEFLMCVEKSSSLQQPNEKKGLVAYWSKNGSCFYFDHDVFESNCRELHTEKKMQSFDGRIGEDRVDDIICSFYGKCKFYSNGSSTKSCA